MIALATANKSDYAVVSSVSSEAGSFAAANLFKPHPFDRWRTSAATGSIVLDMGSPVPVRLLAMLYTNATATATWRWRASDTEGLLVSAPSYDSAVVRHWPGTRDFSTWTRTHAIHLLPTIAAFRFWRLDVDNVGASYYEAGRFIADAPWIPSRGMDYGSAIGYAEQVRRTRSLNGNLYSIGQGMWREAGFRLRVTGTVDQLIEEAEEIDRKRGGSKDVLLMLDIETPNRWMDRSIYGVFGDLRPAESLGLGIWAKSYVVEEWELP